MILVLLQQSVPIYARGDRVPQPFLVMQAEVHVYARTAQIGVDKQRLALLLAVRQCQVDCAGRPCPPGALRM